ncbi:MAG: Holliday junction branch migration protein RuvA [Candidatus Cloacimonadota bacterium]|nr:Holliday junction branch migration protein RuvA [Candidatus Cloacimonadota bacterium]
MLEFIKGEILEKKSTYITVENNGIGYKINISVNTYDKIPKKGNIGKIFLHLNVGEKDFTLYGFHSIVERSVFESLIKVSGIGSKIAISILSGISISNLLNAISENNVKLLTTVPGIGKKTAQRLIVELKDVFDNFAIPDRKEYQVSKENQGIVTDAQNALISLGYNRNSVIKEIRNFITNNKAYSSEEIVKFVIRKFYK